MRPMWEEIEAITPALVTEYFDADNNQDIFEKYGVKDIPTFIFLAENGDEIERLEGVQNKEELVEKIKSYIGK